jgi:predicted nucleic acid-binding protein
MTKVILDTNVLVAAMRSRRGASAAILPMIATGRFDLYLSVTLALEYEHVLKREADSLHLTFVEIDDLVSFLCANSIRCEPRPTLWPLTTDPGDEFLARLAVAAGSDYVVTHNQRHFLALRGAGISVVTPGRFLSIIREA